jgi:hypothetical protein
MLHIAFTSTVIAAPVMLSLILTASVPRPDIDEAVLFDTLLGRSGVYPCHRCSLVWQW